MMHDMNIERDWKEAWVDQMGLIVCLSGPARFEALDKLKSRMAAELTPEQQVELKECFRLRFTPSNGDDGCQSATEAVLSVIDPANRCRICGCKLWVGWKVFCDSCIWDEARKHSMEGKE